MKTLFKFVVLALLIAALASLALTAKPSHIPGADCSACHIKGTVTPAALAMRKDYQENACQDCHVAVKGKITLKG